MEKIRNIDKLIKFFDEENICIYGAGKVARTIVKWALREKKKITAIVVSNHDSNPEEIFGVKVYSTYEFAASSNYNLLIAVMEKSQNDIINNLETDFSQIMCISDETYYEIEREIADYDVEQIQILEWLLRNYQENNIKYYWHHDFEKRVTKANWGDVYNRPDFKKRFLKLISGLDDDSVETVIRILNRQKLYLNSNRKEMDLFTQYEKDELIKQEDLFWSQIIELSPNLYMYKNYFLTSKDFEPSVFYYKHGIEKIHNIEKLRNGVFFDIGGYVGDSAIVLNELLPEKIYTFEALPKHCEAIKENLELNKISNVVIESMALGNTNGFVTMGVCGSSSNAVSRGGIEIEDKIVVPMQTLDNYVKANNIDNIKLIKVDIEGSEPLFLDGAKETITTQRPVLLLSIYHNEHDFFELKPIIESWNLGYKFSIFKSINGNITNETMLIAEVY